MRRIRGTGCAAAAAALMSLAACDLGGESSPDPRSSEPSARGWTTWIVSQRDLGVPPPPREGSRRALAEERELRSRISRRTPRQERVIRRWSQDPAIAPWLELTLDLSRDRFDGTDPPSASRAYALVSVAMHDAAVGAWRAKYRHLRVAPDEGDAVVPRTEPAYPSEHAAVAGAASRVMAHLFAGQQPRDRFEAMAEQAAESRVLAAANRPSDVEAGLRLGRAVARRVVAHARRDRFRSRWNGRRPPHRARYWEPPPGSLARPVRPTAGRARTWLLRTGRDLRPKPPPRHGSREFATQARDVVRARRSLTLDQERIAGIWSGGQSTPRVPGLWNRLALAYVRGAELSTPAAARAFALLNTAMSDAAVAAWDAKYAFWSPRPQNAIRTLRLDRRFRPLAETPASPGYVSELAAYSGAASAVLAHLFPEHASQFRARAEEAAMSGFHAGVQFRIDTEVGLRMGHQIGRLAVERAKKDGAIQDAGESRPDPFRALSRAAAAEEPRGAAPRWRRVRSFSGRGPETRTFRVRRGALQWRARWSCRRGRLRLSAGPQAARGRPLASGRCRRGGEGRSSGNGRLRLKVATRGRWRVVVDQQVDTPVREAPLRDMGFDRLVVRGAFYPVEEPGEGTASVYRLLDGRLALRLDTFRTTPGAGLVVWLSRAPRPRTSRGALSTRHTVLRGLKSTLGDQNYLLPPGTALDRMRSIVIWSPRARKAHTAAALRRPG